MPEPSFENQRRILHPQCAVFRYGGMVPSAQDPQARWLRPTRPTAPARLHEWGGVLMGARASRNRVRGGRQGRRRKKTGSVATSCPLSRAPDSHRFQRYRTLRLIQGPDRPRPRNTACGQSAPDLGDCCSSFGQPEITKWPRTVPCCGGSNLAPTCAGDKTGRVR